MISDISIYIHYPFCIAKCPYCDFNSHSTSNNNLWNNVESLSLSYKKEINYYFNNILEGRKRNIKTIFFGGGTPSLMSPLLVRNIIINLFEIINVQDLDLKSNDSLYDILKDVEITLEANPSSVEANKFTEFKRAGINRVSIGLQALNDNDLKILGRVHNTKDILYAVDVAKNIFDNYSIDLIYARHNQNLEDWKSELEFAIKNLAKDHISAYSLTIEKGTKYFDMYSKGLINIPNQDLSSEFYDITNQILFDNGFKNYEISNYAKNNKESKHNISYWSGADWIGIGAGAHTRVTNSLKQRLAINNIHIPQKWYNSVMQQEHAIQKNTILSTKDLVSEIIIMNMRYNGIDCDYINNKFNINIFDFLNTKKLDFLKSQGLVLIQDSKIQATQNGKLILNSIIKSLFL